LIDDNTIKCAYIGLPNMSVKFRFQIPSNCWKSCKNLRGYLLSHRDIYL